MKSSFSLCTGLRCREKRIREGIWYVKFSGYSFETLGNFSPLLKKILGEYFGYCALSGGDALKASRNYVGDHFYLEKKLFLYLMVKTMSCYL